MAGTPQGLLEQLALVDECRQVLGRLRFYLVSVPESDPPACEEHDGVEALTRRLVDLVGKKVNVFVFRGERWQLTRPPFRHLVPPAGAPVALYMPPNGQLDIDPEGDLADPPPLAPLPDGTAADPAGRPGLSL